MTQDPRRSLAHLAVSVIAADGRVSGSEIAAVSHFDRLGLGSLAGAVQAEMDRVARGAPLDAASACKELGALPAEVATLILATLAEIATSDGALSPQEIDVVGGIAQGLGLSDADAAEVLRAAAHEMEPPSAPRAPRANAPADEIRAGATGASAPEAARAAPSRGERGERGEPGIAWASRVLGVPAEAGIDALNARYRRLVQTYDPAKMIDLGPEFAVLAVQRLYEATTAYRILATPADSPMA